MADRYVDRSRPLDIGLSARPGHEKDIRCQLIAGENELKWTKQYGLVVRLAGCLGVRRFHLYFECSLRLFAAR